MVGAVTEAEAAMALTDTNTHAHTHKHTHTHLETHKLKTAAAHYCVEQAADDFTLDGVW